MPEFGDAYAENEGVFILTFKLAEEFRCGLKSIEVDCNKWGNKSKNRRKSWSTNVKKPYKILR